MDIYDVFNGDADGICALIQLRLETPRNSTLITGVKRDVELIKQLPMDRALDVTALDVSLDKNRAAVDAVLAAGSRVFYVDHHYPGESLPDNPNFTAFIDTQPATCTSLLVDDHLGGRFRNWAITAAFGDNLNSIAEGLARKANLTTKQTADLRELGVCINYNGYGARIEDLYFHPAELYRALLPFSDPLDVIDGESEAWRALLDGYRQDMTLGLAAEPLCRTDSALIVMLPNEAWARRVSGVLGNELANRNPDAACAIVTETGDDHYLVSIRAPLNNRTGADEVARQFPTGGGRKAAAGINKLPASELDAFIDIMKKHWK